MNVKILKKETLLKDFFKVDVVELQHEKFAGGWGNSIRRLNLDRGEAAAVLIYLEDKDSFVLVRQFRYAVYESGGDGWIDEVVAGVLENDTPIECAKRECLEETGYRIRRLEKMGSVYSTPGITSERVHLFIGFCKSADKIKKGGGVDHENEDIQVLEIPRKELLNKLNKHELNDMKSIILLQYFQKCY